MPENLQIPEDVLYFLMDENSSVDEMPYGFTHQSEEIPFIAFELKRCAGQRDHFMIAMLTMEREGAENFTVEPVEVLLDLASVNAGDVPTYGDRYVGPLSNALMEDFLVNLNAQGMLLNSKYNADALSSAFTANVMAASLPQNLHPSRGTAPQKRSYERPEKGSNIVRADFGGRKQNTDCNTGHNKDPDFEP